MTVVKTAAKRTSEPHQYVLVQHSCFAHNGDSRYAGGLENRRVSVKKAIKLARLGVRVYRSYREVTDDEMRLMYNGGDTGLAPRADLRGHFLDEQVDKLCVYVAQSAFTHAGRGATGFIKYAGVTILTTPGLSVFDVGTARNADGQFCDWIRFYSLNAAKAHINKEQCADDEKEWNEMSSPDKVLGALTAYNELVVTD